MRYLSVCSGIEAATVAWHPLGWAPAAFSEIDKFPRAVLAHHYPDVPLHGDFTTIRGDEYGPIDLLVGGTPCQDFSIAGLRAGIAGERGNLTLEFLRLAARVAPRWIVWENVPGVLSSDGGRALGSFLGGLAELGYGFAYRVLDAQYFGLAQRRARVFVVGHLGDWRRAAAVLFERESLQGHPAPRREAGKGIARPITPGSPGGSGYRNDADTADNLVMAHGQANAEIGRDQCPTLTLLHEAPILAHALRAEGFDASEDGTGRGTPLVATALRARDMARGVDSDCTDTLIAHAFDAGQSDVIQYGDKTGPLDTDGWTMAILESGKRTGESSTSKKAGDGIGAAGDPMFTLGTDSRHAVAFSSRFKGDDGRGYERPPQTYVEHVGAIDTVTRHAVAFTQNSRSEVRHIGGDGQIVGAVPADAGAQQQNYLANGMAVRRLTPRECERLQGFPDDYTLIEYRGRPAADGPRYKALGNSMAVPVMRWIGERIAMVEAISTEARAA